MSNKVTMVVNIVHLKSNVLSTKQLINGVVVLVDYLACGG